MNKRFQVIVEIDVWREIRQLAFDQKKTKGKIVKELIESYVEREENETR